VTRLSEHFTLQEFLRSEAAARHGIDMTPSKEIVANLERLANEVLEPIREAVGVPLVITSGYRPPALNALVGGAPASDHMSGRAADFHAIGMSLEQLGRIVKKQAQSLPVAKAIWEFGQWIHIAIEPHGRVPSRRFLAASRENGATVYKEWA
jgi:zinc D-Ala-D-Ala carboxypeptidase